MSPSTKEPRTSSILCFALPSLSRFIATALRSPKYPNLNPILATDSTHVRWDVKTPPVSGILGSTFVSSRHQFALAQPTQHIRLMSKAFPWQIELVTPVNTTCEDIWTAVYNCLQQVIEDSEWGFISQDKRIRETIEKASKKRMERDNSADPRPRRVDYLGEATMFKGLEKDDDFAKVRLYPGHQPLAETWVIKLDK